MSRAPVQISRWLGRLGALAPGGVIRSLACLVLAGATFTRERGTVEMRQESRWCARGALVVCALVWGLVGAGGASALSNGDPCSPFWTEVASPFASLMGAPASISPRVPFTVDAQFSISGTADKWTYVSADNLCEATSTVRDPISSYTWDFGDGSPPETHPVPDATSTHVYSTQGTYTITLTVTEQNCQAGADAHCFTGQATARVVVKDHPPNASFTAPATVQTGEVASFDASTSSDDDGSVTAYHWDFGDGQSLDTAGPVASHTYTRGGQKTVTLTVTDNDGSTGQNQQIVSVIDRPPSASFTAPASVGKGQPARFDASGSADPDGAITTYRWDFGDGQTQSTTNPVTTHTYNQGGRKAVALTVIDDSGNSASAQHAVTVTVGFPSASFTAPAAVAVGHAAVFDASASSDPNGAITSYRWDFGDGQTRTTTAPTASHTYATSGTVTVTLTISDNNGGAAVSQRSLKVLSSACVVPRLLGKKLGPARQALIASGCQLGAVKHRRTRPRQRRRVIKQSVRPGAVRPAGQPVAVTIGK